VTKIKRIYKKPEKSDGFRILVDRLWPRGIKKNEAQIDLWIKDIAPSGELRRWYSHDRIKWPQFKKKYFNELKDKKDLVEIILTRAKSKNVTLLYSAKEEKYNNAAALKQYLTSQ
jgi:uncharacterized protein YeaO (DUF488 family)